jgi:parallel beta-helix repeat protein
MIDNGNGIYLTWMASDNIISNNNISSNNNGVYLYAPASNNRIIRNYISSNTEDGIHLGSLSDYNKIYHNNIINNFNQAYDVANGNFWNDTYPSGGNYWSNYGPICTDNNDGAVTPQVGGGGSDGICDNQFDIDGDSTDFYPHTNPIDTTAPTITNLQPQEGSITNDNMTTIGADYSDADGIDLGSIYLNVDGVDVSSSSSPTASGVTYTPVTALSDGTHYVYLKVNDTLDNMATELWSFYVDASPPDISNLLPSDGQITNNVTPMISANYSDEFGINLSSVLLEVDSVDVTSFANVMANGLTYIPGLPLSEASHNVYLEVNDTTGNMATASWSFSIETTPPSITNMQPPNTATIVDTTPFIIADYSDPSGINMSSVLIMVDGVDVTAISIVTINDFMYISGSPMSDGTHDVYIEVRDIAGNLATESWSFNIDSDTTPPVVSNEQPPHTSTTNDDTPLISVDYSDPSGILLSNVVLFVDGINVTASASVTPSGVSYTPATALSEGDHDVYMEVVDASFSSNLVTYSWSFTVDTTDLIPPTISNMQPPDASSTNDHTPMIGADYNDFSGINISSVLLEVDGTDVTVSAFVTSNGITYTPTIPLADGVHTVYLEVRDESPAQNLAWESWSFTVIDNTPPIPTNLNPPDTSITNDNTPTISVNYSDPSGIDVSTIVLTVDGLNVTSSATINADGLTYTPASPLSDALHTVILYVNDTIGNLATISWSFTVDVTYDPIAPDIMNLKPDDGSTINDNSPTISADYSDASGIDVNSVILKIDGVDVTSHATITEDGIIYIPSTHLPDGTYTVYLEVSDNSALKNKATETWSFTVNTTEVDTQPPQQKDFISEYWWLLLIIVIIVVLTILMLIFWLRKKKKKAQAVTRQYSNSIEEPQER